MIKIERKMRDARRARERSRLLTASSYRSRSCWERALLALLLVEHNLSDTPLTSSRLLLSMSSVADGTSSSTTVPSFYPVGTLIEKQFSSGTFLGEIIEYDSSTGFHHVVYSDGDSEDLETHEVTPLLLLPESPPDSAPHSSPVIRPCDRPNSSVANRVRLDVPTLSQATEPAAAKKQKTYDADGPIEDDKTAREKLREAGFDPDDVHTARSDLAGTWAGWANITPMTYFARAGDLPMCRYLYHVRGATTTAAAEEHKTKPNKLALHPMHQAIPRNQIAIVKWLFNHGAKEDAASARSYIWKLGKPSINVNPFAWCLSSKNGVSGGPIRWRHPDLAKWFILNGALDDSDGNIDVKAFKKALIYVNKTQWYCPDGLRGFFLDWSESCIKSNVSFHVFLLGTAKPPKYTPEALRALCSKKLGNTKAAALLVDGSISTGTDRTVWKELTKPADNACLEAFPGVLERIADYVGVTKSKSKMRRMMQFRAAVLSLSPKINELTSNTNILC